MFVLHPRTEMKFPQTCRTSSHWGPSCSGRTCRVSPCTEDLVRRLGLAQALPDMSLACRGGFFFAFISGFIMVHASEPLFEHSGRPAQFLETTTNQIVPLYWMVRHFILRSPRAPPLPHNAVLAQHARLRICFFPLLTSDGLKNRSWVQVGLSTAKSFLYALLLAVTLPRTKDLLLVPRCSQFAVMAGIFFALRAPCILVAGDRGFEFRIRHGTGGSFTCPAYYCALEQYVFDRPTGLLPARARTAWETRAEDPHRSS